MRRRLTAASVPTLAVVVAWASFETTISWWTFALIGLIGLCVTVPRQARLQVGVAALALCVIAVAEAAEGPASVTGAIGRGLRELYFVSAPFDAAVHPDVHLLVVLGASSLVFGIAMIAARSPFVAAAVTAGAVAWPAMILPGRNTATIGALVLVATLWPVLVAGVRDLRGITAGAVAVGLAGAAGVATVAAGAGPSSPGVAWQDWDLFGAGRVGRTVAQVWDSDYGGIDFPARPTTVLRIVAPRRALYWRATTLDTFAGDRWVEAPAGIARISGDEELPLDPLLPPSARTSSAWVEQEIEVEALVDDHVIAAAQPMRVGGGKGRELLLYGGGVMRSPGGLGEMRRYSVSSYAPRPEPAALDRSPPIYPSSLDRYLDIGRAVAPPFQQAGRAELIASLFSDELYQPFWPYEGLWEETRRLTARARSPYEATIAIERWLRTDGAFTYDEHPPAARSLPPLADFVGRTKRGYCQQFAGAMTLMLRLLGVPARVAAGFTSGTWKNGAWIVTDHDAHTWVEVWFAGHGWLAFDPTPERGNLSAEYTNASDSADAIRALGSGRYFDLGRQAPTPPRQEAAPVEVHASAGRAWWPFVPLALAAIVLAVLALVKEARRRSRYATSDPRLCASGAKAELAGFLRDQGARLGAAATMGAIVLELRRVGVAGESFAQAFSRARYGPPERASVAADEARVELARTLSRLRARCGPARRLKGFFALRSLRS